MDSNLLSSICLGGGGARSKYPGCVNVFLHLFDWNRGLSSSKRGLLPAGPAAADSSRMHSQEPRSASASTRKLKKKQQQRQKKQQRKQAIVDQEERPQLPMAKLLLIADEKRRGSRRSFSSRSHAKEEALLGSVEFEEEKDEPKPGEVHSLQELLHLDSEPAMLQELVLGNPSISSRDEISPAQHLFSLLLQEAKVTPPISGDGTTGTGKDDGNTKRWSPSSKRRRRPAGGSSSRIFGCSGGFTKGFFLDAAAKILEPSLARTKRIGFESEDEEGTTGASTCSIPSLMDLFSDNLSDSSSTRMTTTTSTVTSRDVQQQPELEPVPVHDLGSQEYVSFRDFLTRSCSSSSSRSSLSSASSSKIAATKFADPKKMNVDECKLDDDMSNFVVLDNPLFEAEDEEEDCSSSSRQQQPSLATTADSLSLDTASDVFGSEQGDEDDDQSLEDMLKSILSDATKQRITWSPHESYVFNNNKECSSSNSSSSSHESKSVDEATSESNCSEDCQPSPVSVLDASLFDDDIPRKGGKEQHCHRSSSRKKLEFGEPSPALLDTTASTPSLTPTTTTGCADPTEPAAASQYEDADTLEEAFDYVTMILRDSGLPLHKEAMLLLLLGDSARLLDDQLFNRLEDRMRVEQLIEHLEAYNGGERQPLNLLSLRSQCQNYHDYRAQRRIVFDFVAETLDTVLDELAVDDQDDYTTKPSLRSMSGMDVAVEVEARVRRWRRPRLETAVVDHDIATKLDRCHERSLKMEASAAVAECERQILGDLLDDLVNELLAQSQC